MAASCLYFHKKQDHVAATANYELTMMYWHIGARINHDILGNERAAYGKQIVTQLATQLQAIYGSRGYEVRNIRRMIQFASLFLEEKIMSQIATKLNWSHFIEVFPLKNTLKQEFYLTLSAANRWGRDRLRSEIDGMLFERTAIAQTRIID